NVSLQRLADFSSSYAFKRHDKARCIACTGPPQLGGCCVAPNFLFGAGRPRAREGSRGLLAPSFGGLEGMAPFALVPKDDSGLMELPSCLLRHLRCLRLRRLNR